MQNYCDLLSHTAVNVLNQELKLCYAKLNSFNAFKKAGDKFDAGDWGMCIAIFGLGYLKTYIQNKLDESEMHFYNQVYENAQFQFIKNIFGETEAPLIHSKCLELINNRGEAKLFFDVGTVASEDKEGIRKHIATLFVTKYNLFI